MLTVHLLGHAHVTYNNRPVPLSAKAVALITYLTIEKLPQHRERLADLLWNTPEARKNLRVELARIRSAGLNLFPLSRQLLYLENVETDLSGWLAGLGGGLDQAGLAQWLSTLRGVPLSGLEDLGSPAFQEWTDHQRWVLTEQTEEVLARAYRQFQRAGKGWGTRAIAARAEALGFTHPGEFLMADAEAGLELPEMAAGLPAALSVPLPDPAPLSTGRPDLDTPVTDGPLHFRVPEREAALRESLKRAAHAPQVVVLHGPTGSGKSHEAGRALTESGWLSLQISNSRAGRLIVATLAQALLAHPFFPTLAGGADGEQPAAPDAGHSELSGNQSASNQSATNQSASNQTSSVQTLQGVLLRPGSLEEDVVKVATVLATLPRPLAIVLDHAHNGPVELASVLEFLLNVPSAAPRALVMLSRTPPSQAPLCRALLRRFSTVQSSVAQSSGAQSSVAQALVLEIAPLSPGSVVQALGAQGAYRGSPGWGDADLHARAAMLVQRSGGNALHLLSLLQENELEQGECAGRLPPAGHLPSAMRETYLGEIDGWPAPLRAALSSLSVIQGDFSFGLAGSFPEAARRGMTPAALLREALERRALVETEPASALSWPAFSPVGDVAPGEPCYRFRAEGLRTALSGQLPQTERQELRRHLAAELEATQPGLALYYAERAGADADAERLRVAYRSRLPAGSPLLRPLQPVTSGQIRAAQVLSAPGLIALPAPPVPEPRRWPVSARPAVAWQGYLLSWEQGGWLSILSQGRYGHPHTLRVHLPIPANLRGTPTLTLRLVWRLDVFHAGHELGPGQMAFPLRFSVPGADAAQVLTPDSPGDYTEEGQRQQVGADVTLGGWMEHELHFNMAGQAAERLDLQVRALDLALTIGELSLNGQSILPLTAAPERPAVLGNQDAHSLPRSLTTRH